MKFTKLTEERIERQKARELERSQKRLATKLAGAEQKSIKSRIRSARRRDAKSYKDYGAADVVRLKRIQGDKCVYCGKPILDYHIDHIKPIAKGGVDRIDNLAISCPECNLAKSDKDLKTFTKDTGKNYDEIVTKIAFNLSILST